MNVQRLFLLALAFVVTLGAALGVLLDVSLIPFFHQIGIAMTVLVIVAIGCALVLLSRRIRERNHERLIVSGEVAFYVLKQDEDIYHASMLHEQGKAHA